MKKTAADSQDTAALGKALPAMLNTALSLDNLEPFLNNIAGLLAGPDGVCPGGKVEISIKAARGRPALSVSRSCSPTGKVRPPAPGKARYSGRHFSSVIRTGNERAGLLTVTLKKISANPFAAAAMIELAAKVIGARLTNETRDTELRRQKDLASSVKHIEELYLSFPDISIEEISRAVLDEARRLTGSRFGFAGYIDPASGHMLIPSFTTGTWDSCSMKEKPAVFTQFSGLWGWVLKNKKPLLTNKAREDRRARGIPHGHIRIEKFMGAPAMSGRKLLGMLALANPQRDFVPEDLDAVQKLALVYALFLQRKAAEDRRKDEDTRFKTIVSSTRDVIYTVDLSARLTYISPRAEEYGYIPEELIGRKVTDFAHPDDKEFLRKAFVNALATGHTLPILPYRLRRKDGSYAYVAQKSGILLKNGRPECITGIVRDVTDQRRTEILLKESEALMRMVFETAKDAIFIKDMNGMYVKVNKACADFMRTTPAEMIGRSDSDYFPQQVAAAVFRTDSEVVRTGKTLSLNNLHPFPGGQRYVNIIKTPLRNSAGETMGLLGIARDITDLKRMETELALSRAAEAVSNVARPIAHDFNNALAAINGYATLIDDDLKPDSPIKNEISRIIEAVKRAAELTSRFQDFARNPKIENPGEAGGGKDGGK
jgi:PAS domain S-box-containing protein